MDGQAYNRKWNDVITVRLYVSVSVCLSASVSKI